jgi:hypothetical protein
MLQLFSEPAVASTVAKRASGRHRGVLNTYLDITKEIKDEKGQRAFNSIINVHANAMIGNTMSDIGRYSDIFAEGVSGRMINTMFKKTGIYSYEHRAKGGAIGFVSHSMFLHKEMGRGFEEFVDMQAREFRLTTYGITKDEFDLFTSLETFNAIDGKKYLTTDPIKDIDDFTIKQKLLGGRGSKVAIDSARRELQRKFAGFYLDVANTAILTPNASDLVEGGVTGTATDGKPFENTAATARVGDEITIINSGLTAGGMASGVKGIWVRNNA